METAVVHIDGFERRIHTGTDLLPRQAKILGAEGNVFFNDGSNDLIVGILKNDPNLFPDLELLLCVSGVDPVDEDAPLIRQQKRV